MTAHLIPGCDGYAHADGVCEVELGSMPVVVGDLVVTVNATDEQPAELVVWNDSGDLLRTTDQAKAVAFAHSIRGFAASIDKAAALLASPSVGPANPEPVDYAARFAALDSDVLFDVEDSADCDAASKFVESLLIVLAEWRPRIVAMLADAPEWAVPEAAAYRRALDRTREAWLQYSFRWADGPDLPYPFDPPETGSPQAGQVTDAGKPAARITRPCHRDLIVREVAA